MTKILMYCEGQGEEDGYLTSIEVEEGDDDDMLVEFCKEYYKEEIEDFENIDSAEMWKDYIKGLREETIMDLFIESGEVDYVHFF